MSFGSTFDIFSVRSISSSPRRVKFDSSTSTEQKLKGILKKPKSAKTYGGQHQNMTTSTDDEMSHQMSQVHLSSQGQQQQQHHHTCQSCETSALQQQQQQQQQQPKCYECNKQKYFSFCFYCKQKNVPESPYPRVTQPFQQQQHLLESTRSFPHKEHESKNQFLLQQQQQQQQQQTWRPDARLLQSSPSRRIPSSDRHPVPIRSSSKNRTQAKQDKIVSIFCSCDDIFESTVNPCYSKKLFLLT